MPYAPIVAGNGKASPARGGRDAAGRARRIPEATVARLPVYERILTEMLRAGSKTVSSEGLAARAGVNAAKVRKDFSLFGSFGTRGTGYDAAFLVAQISRALGSDRDWPVVIVGIGNLGRALANSDGFSSHGFRVAGLYDVAPSVVGTTVGALTVRHVDELATAGGGALGPCTAAIAVITTPASGAQAVADLLVGAGAASILNFSPRVLSVPPGVLVRSVDLSIELQVMSFYLVWGEGGTPPTDAPGAAASRIGAAMHTVGLRAGGAG